MTTHSTISVGSTVIAQVDALQDADGSYVNDATVTLESLTDKNGDAVENVSTPVTLTYVSGSNGRYRGTLSHTAGFTAEQWYNATYLAIDGSTRKEWLERIRAKKGSA